MPTNTKTWIPHSPSMCLEYNWSIVINKETVSTLMKTQFIGFPGVIQKAFRLSLEMNDKNELAQVCCYINSIELGRLGYKARAATFAQNRMFGKLYELENVSDDESLAVLFRWDKQRPIMELPLGHHILVFHVYLSGGMDGYSLCRFDGLLSQQLWNAAVDKQSTDVNFKVFDATFSAHKFILAARSPVFRAMFATDMTESRTGQVIIVDVEDSDIFEQFLRFIYTGQLSGPASTQLGLLAEKYQVDTLAFLCRTIASDEKTFADSVLALATTRGNTTSVLSGRQELSLLPHQGQPVDAALLLTQSYTLQDLDIHSIIDKEAQKILGTPYLFKVECTVENDVYLVKFYSWAKESTVRIAAVDLVVLRDHCVILKLEMRPIFSPGAPLEVFSAKINVLPNFAFRFLVHRASLSNAFQYQLRDSLLPQQLWSSAVSNEWTDVEFIVGSVAGGKTFPAHLAILTARCPALAALVPASSLSSSSQATVHIANMDPTVFSSLLYFLYTGSVEEISFTSSLSDVARSFGMDSLRLGGSHFQLDQDKLSDVLLSLFS